jgi:hypothetical protein
MDKKEIAIKSLQITLLAGLLFAAFSQDGGSSSTSITSIDLSAVETGIRNVNKEFLGIAKKIVQGIMFLVALWQLIEGYMRHQLKDKWMFIVGIALFIGLIELFPTIYKQFTGYNPI